MKMCRGNGGMAAHVIKLAPDGGERSDSRPSRFAPWLGGPQSRSLRRARN
jgi:hypothetical protein